MKKNPFISSKATTKPLLLPSSMKPTLKIQHPEVFQIAKEKIQTGLLPKSSFQTIKAGTLMLRGLDRKYLATPIEAITPRPESTKKDYNRANGIQPDGQPGNTSIYLGLATAQLAETYHYTIKDYPQGLVPYGVDARKYALCTKIRYRYRVRKDLLLVDMDSPELLDFLAQSSDELKQYIQAKRSLNDYSLHRGIALGVSKLGGFKGTRFLSRRLEIGDPLEDGDNYALNGEEGVPLEDDLEPESLEIIRYDTRRKDFVTTLHQMILPSNLAPVIYGEAAKVAQSYCEELPEETTPSGDE